MSDGKRCPECKRDELEFLSEEIACQTRYEPATYRHSARCLDCSWEGDCDDLEEAPASGWVSRSEKAAEDFLDGVIEEMGNKDRR